MPHHIVPAVIGSHRQGVEGEGAENASLQVTGELASVPDEGAIQEFAPERADPAFSERVRHWRLHRHLEDLEAFGSRLAIDYIDHYNTHRSHRSLNQQPPEASPETTKPTPPSPIRVIKSNRCDGLINEYRNAA